MRRSEKELLHDALAAIRRSEAPEGMRCRVVAVDGPGGAGKSSLSEWLAAELGAPVVHTDDFASWDNPIEWWPTLLEKVLRPLAAGHPARYLPNSWGGPARDQVTVEPQDFVILEGVTASRAAFRPYLAYRIWIETPRQLRLKRGIERDGEEMRRQWLKCMEEEDRYVEQERPEEHADLVLPGDKELWAEASEQESMNEPVERRTGRGRVPRTEMVSGELIRLIHALEAAGVTVWLDGGWGVDALLGEQRREHDDLDVVIEMRDVSALQEALRSVGYSYQHRKAPLSFEIVDSEGRQVDVHPIVFDERGNGVYRMDSGKTWVYPAEGFAGVGQVAGEEVRCLTPQVQMLVHSGYELSAKDHEEIRVLQERFGVEPPPGYQHPE